jgi:uncharacterized protein YbaP (TraB family)
MRSAVAAFGAYLLLSVAAPAADPPPVSDWVSNEVVEVTAKAPGPAFWHIKKGDSEIWILGIVAPLTKGVEFKEDHLVEVLKGSRAIFTPPSMSAGIVSVGWFFLTRRSVLSMPDGKRLSDSLPVELRTRFLAAKAAAKLDAKDLEDASPIYASVKLQNAYIKAKNLGNAMGDVVALAKKEDVPVKSIGDYDAMDMVREVAVLPQVEQQKCLADMVEFTERSAVHTKALTEAWAVGDLKSIKAHFVRQPFGECIKQASAFGKFSDRATADYLKAIREALAKPGKVVMLVNIGTLLAATGVVETLHKEGLTIEGPPE